jgi:hypothetical protein
MTGDFETGAPSEPDPRIAEMHARYAKEQDILLRSLLLAVRL